MVKNVLTKLGKKVSELRRQKGISREELAKRSGLSVRFLAEIESGRGNIALTRLVDLCTALGIPPEGMMTTIVSTGKALTEESNGRPPVIALVGLRGAGKTTIGKKLAKRLRRRFVELDDLIEKAAGLTLQNIFEVHGEDYYGQLEKQALLEFLTAKEPSILAVGGGIVTRQNTFGLLREQCVTIWLKADPEDHWNRVLHQDPRPITNYPNAFAQLQTLLRQRELLYAQADFQINTSKLGIKRSIEEILRHIRKSSKNSKELFTD